MHEEEYALGKVFEALFDQVKEVETVKFQRNFSEKSQVFREIDFKILEKSQIYFPKPV